MELKEEMICKHFKGETLLEKNIYRILTVKPVYTGTKESFDPIVTYKNLFQDGITFIREYSDLVAELSDKDKGKYHQSFRVQPLTDEELAIVFSDEFVKQKLAYIEEKNKKETVNNKL